MSVNPNHKPNDPRKYCRICGHAESRHDQELLGIEKCGWVSAFLDIAYQYEFCSCSRYVSSDNLEFLEYKLKLKESEKLSL
jgi:hypothetical protein